MFEKGVLFIAVIGVVLGGVATQAPCSNGEDFSPHPNCSLYYSCAGSTPFLQECPSNPILYFNPLISACDFPANVPECVGGTRPPTGTTTPVPTTTTPTTTTPTTTTPTTTTPTTTTPTTTTPTTTTQATTTPTTTRTTDTPETEGTPTTTTSLPPLRCDATGIHKIAVPDRCDAYYWCINGQLQPDVHFCPEGLLFDPQIRDCNFENQVNCGSTNGTTTGTTTPTTTPPSTEWPECKPGENTAHPYPGNCTLYIVCVDGSMTFYKCPEGMLFDYVMKQCRPENVAVCASSYSVPIVQKNTAELVKVLSANKDLTTVQEDNEEQQTQWQITKHFTSLRILWTRVWTRIYY